MKNLTFLSLICGMLFFSFNVAAINVMPFSGALDLTQQSNYKIEVSNNSRAEAAVKITIMKWSFDEFGVERRERSNDLIVFPKHFLLGANTSRSVRVSYRNGIPPRTEKAYRIIVEEVPMAKKQYVNYKKGASINVLTRYVTSFYIKPRNAKSTIAVISSKGIDNGFQVKIRNEGNAHTHFISPSITLNQTGSRLIVNDLSLLKPFTNTNIFPLADRIYDWQVPESLKNTFDFSQPYRVTIDWVCENCAKTKDQINFVVE